MAFSQYTTPAPAVVVKFFISRNDTSVCPSPASSFFALCPRRDQGFKFGRRSLCNLTTGFGEFECQVKNLRNNRCPCFCCTSSISTFEASRVWRSGSRFCSELQGWLFKMDHSGRPVLECHREAMLPQRGSQCKESIFSQIAPSQNRAHSSRLVALAAEVASVTTGEENVGNSASTATEANDGRKTKASGQLARWARARKIRAGKLNPVLKKVESSSVAELDEVAESGQLERVTTPETGDDDEFEHGEDYSANPIAYDKSIYMVSDGTGWTADHSVHAALGQFEHCMVDRRCSVDTHLFSDVNDVDMLMGIIRHAGLQGGLVVYTLADPTMADAAKEACELLGVPHIDILGPITDAIGNHLGVSPLGLPRGAPGRKKTLSKQYFKRIEAVEFTIKQDDGALPKNLQLADVVLVGVSRTSKTPLSTYIAQKGYKVANVPLVYGIDPPKELFQIDQDKVYGLTINANFLKAIRLARYRHLGVSENSSSSYSDMEHIRRELDYSRKLFSQNPRWPVIEVTGKAIEETAAVILRLYHERRNKYSMPRISTRY